MADQSSSVTKGISFKCRACEGPAKIVYDDGSIQRVFCPACSASVDGAERAGEMYQTLLLPNLKEEGRNFFRRMLRKRGMGRVPLRKVDNESSDQRWPFILVARSHD